MPIAFPAGSFFRLAILVLFSTADGTEHGEEDKLTASLIDRSIDAYGGSNLRELRSLVLEWNTDDMQVFESQTPNPPWDKVRRWEAFAIDFDSERRIKRLDASRADFWLAVGFHC